MTSHGSGLAARKDGLPRRLACYLGAVNNLDTPHLASLRDLLVSRSIFLGEFTLASGIRSDYYIDARLSTMSGKGQEALGWIGFEFVRGLAAVPTHVGGLTLGADPIAYAIAHRCTLEGFELDAFTVRKQPKDHGLAQLVEGPATPQAHALVVEDCVTTGTSALQAVHALRGIGATVDNVLAIVDRSQGRASRLMTSHGLTLSAMFEGGELARRAVRGPRAVGESA